MGIENFRFSKLYNQVGVKFVLVGLIVTANLGEIIELVRSVDVLVLLMLGLRMIMES